ncbi:MAG: hypothetical protein ACXAC5_01305 [Promethearchaeota archaeon]|jgi:hypothetical protein
MNWFQKLSQTYSPDDIIQGVLNGVFDGSGPSPTQPEGGWAYQRFRAMGPVACEQINTAAGQHAAAYKEMQVLAEAAGCNWNPEPIQPQPENAGVSAEPMVMPPMGQQEKPMAMPSAEIV